MNRPTLLSIEIKVLAFNLLSSAAGSDIDVPGIVGEFTLDDTSTRRSNRRNGYFYTILKWESTKSPATPNSLLAYDKSQSR